VLLDRGGDQWPWLVLLISGVDLYSPSRQRALGQIWESNSPLLTVLLNRLGYALAHQLVGGDQPEPLRDALLQLARQTGLRPGGRTRCGTLPEVVPQAGSACQLAAPTTQLAGSTE
jgi:hypothetical protein